MQNPSQAIQKREAPSASQNPFESSSRIMQLGLLGLISSPRESASEDLLVGPKGNPPRLYQIQFYVDASGDSPVERWLQDLPPVEAYALGSALDGLLQQSGPLLCVLRPQYASSLGGGLYEFRFQDLTEDLLRQLGKKPRLAMLNTTTQVLFRVFFHPYGNKVILLLGAYDKAKHSSPTYQNAQIRLARKRLADWQARQRQRRK